MSDNVPLEIQEEIMKRLPVKSLIRFRSVCKAWKSLIDSTDFINHYSGQTPYLLAKYKTRVEYKKKYVLFPDDHTFPHKRVLLNSHPLVNMLYCSKLIGISHGLLCFYGDYREGRDGPFSATGRAVVWNPSIGKAVAIDVSNVSNELMYGTFLGFGVCGETNDPKIVKITYIITRWIDRESIPDSIPWQVEVYTLSTGAWRPPYSSNLPRKSIQFECYQVVVDGMLYWLATDDTIAVDGGFQSYNLIISFDITSEEFREVNLPHKLAHLSLDFLSLYKLKESLVVLEFDIETNNLVFRVWIMEDIVPKSFTTVFSIDIPDNVSEVYLKGFRKTGEAIIDSEERYPEWTGSLAVYDPYSKSISSLGVDGSDFSSFEPSYIETLLLL